MRLCRGGRRSGSGRLFGPSTLQRLCEKTVASSLVEPRTVLPVLEFADAAGSQALKQHCIRVRIDTVMLYSIYKGNLYNLNSRFS